GSTGRQCRKFLPTLPARLRRRRRDTSKVRVSARWLFPKLQLQNSIFVAGCSAFRVNRGWDRDFLVVFSLGCSRADPHIFAVALPLDSGLLDSRQFRDNQKILAFIEQISHGLTKLFNDRSLAGSLP